MQKNNLFKNLLTKYNTWKELEKYLESEEGGFFRVVDRKANLCTIRYQKGTSNMNLPHSNWFRSVVWNTTTNLPVCVAPPKATNAPFPYATVNDAKNAGVKCQEQIDGFMINCFRMLNDSKLYITSRSKLDAAGHFYSNKPFRQLFAEAYLNCTFDTVEEMEESLQKHSLWMDAPNRMKNEVAVFYSFLVQHTSHRVVSHISNNAVYLIHKGTVYEDGSFECNDEPMNVPVQQIPCITMDSNTDFIKWVKETYTEKSWDFQGVVCKDVFGNRWRFLNDKYSAVKSLRGNSESSLDRFAQLYTQNLTYKYLEYFTEEAFYFSCHTVFMNNIIDTIYRYYVSIYIIKEISLNEADKMYIPHLYALHGIYLSSLRSEGKKLSQNDIQQYFYKLPWQRIAFLIRENQNAYFTHMEQMVSA
jgi:hypothetical protein